MDVGHLPAGDIERAANTPAGIGALAQRGDGLMGVAGIAVGQRGLAIAADLIGVEQPHPLGEAPRERLSLLEGEDLRRVGGVGTVDLEPPAFAPNPQALEQLADAGQAVVRQLWQRRAVLQIDQPPAGAGDPKVVRRLVHDLPEPGALLRGKNRANRARVAPVPRSPPLGSG